MFGIVEDVNQKEGAILIKTLATLVYGVIGFGNQRGGTLQFVGNQTGPVYSSQISTGMNQHILVAGALVFRDALKKAAGLGVQGVVSGGLNLADYRAIVGSLDVKQRMETDVGITVLASEGFGPLPMGEDIYQILREFENNFDLIDGHQKQLILPSDKADSIIRLRKISLPQTLQPVTEPEVQLGELALGIKVRLVWPPLMGAQGKVVAIDNSPTMLESGISTYLVTVETSQRKVKVPFTNVEIII